MPIEIRELQIVAVVSETPENTNTVATPVQDTEKIIATCVEQVLDILKSKTER
jgi:Family of unknown function (DUF5908)